jgi:nucleoside-diphosphate-sugar epimerase
MACCDKAIGETINIGSNFEISVGETIAVIRRLMRSEVEFITDNERLRPGKSEVFRLWCNNQKIRNLTGFKPEFSIEAGLQATIDWFTRPENLSKYKADIYNV